MLDCHLSSWELRQLGEHWELRIQDKNNITASIAHSLSCIPFNVTETGELGFTTRSHITLQTLKWHIIALVVSCRPEHVVVVSFVTGEQVPQSEIMYFGLEQSLKVTEFHENISLSFWAPER